MENSNVKRIELTSSPNYIEDWTIQNAFREVIQNGIDEQTRLPDNKFSIRFNESESELVFANENATLAMKSLLFGGGDKITDEDTVGHFGEGYKCAALVSLRTRKTFTVYNNGKNEVWRFCIEHSDNFDSDLIVVYIEEVETEKTNLEFVIGNVGYYEYESIGDIWLHFAEYDSEMDYIEDNRKYMADNRDEFCDDEIEDAGILEDIDRAIDPNRESDIIHTDYGDILLNSAYRGKIYVNGLSVEEVHARLKYGYDFKPKYIKLERDRKSANSWDIKRQTAKMISQAIVEGNLSIVEITKSIYSGESKVEDIEYLEYDFYNHDRKKFMEIFEEDYYNNYPGTIPVRNQKEYEYVKSHGGNPNIVTYSIAKIFGDDFIDKSIKEIVKNDTNRDLTIKGMLMDWFVGVEKHLSSGESEEFLSIIERLKE